MAQARVPVFFAVSTYLRYEYFGMVWGIAYLGDPPKTNLFNDLIYGTSVF